MERKEKSPEGLVDEVEAYVKKLPRRDQVKIFGTLFERDLWPEELPMKPDGWESMGCDERLDITMPIYDRIPHRLYKASLQYWYTQIRGYSKKEFREYWESRYKGAEKEPDYMIWAYIMGICTGIQVALIIVRIVLKIRGVI